MNLGSGQQHRYGAEPLDQLCAELAGCRDLEAGEVGHLAYGLLGGVKLLQAAHVQGQHLCAFELTGRSEVLDMGAPQGNRYRLRVAGAEVGRLVDHGETEAAGVGTLIAAGQVHQPGPGHVEIAPVTAEWRGAESHLHAPSGHLSDIPGPGFENFRVVEMGARRDLIDEQYVLRRGCRCGARGDEQKRRRGKREERAHQSFRDQSNRMPMVSSRWSTASA